MSKKVISRTDTERKEKANANVSMRIGMLSCIVVIITFAIERIFLPFLKYSSNDKLVVLLLIGIFLVLPIFIFFGLFTKEDAKYNVD